MDEATLNAILEGGDDRVYALDNVMLEARVVGGSGGKKPRAPPPPEAFIGPIDAEAMLRGLPAPPSEDNDFETSCSDLDDNYDQDFFLDDDDDDERIDEMFDGSVSSSRANRSMAATNRLISSGGHRHRKARRDNPVLNCFGCAFSSRTDSNDKHIASDKMNSLMRIFDDLYGKIDSRVLARMCHAYFMKEVYKPLSLRGVKIHLWRTKQIYEHFTKHQLEPRVMLAQQIVAYNRISAALELTTFERTEGGSGVKPNKDNLAMKLRVDAHVLKLYAMDPGKLNFHNPTCKIDFGQMGLLMGPYRNFSFQ
jgi:hypothetical protein